jgi:glycosyltransferase involved in cell wall biosynthesis
MHLRITKGFYRNSFYRLCYNKLMTSWILKYATKIAAVSESAMTAYMGSQWQADPRTTVIYNGVNVAPFLVAYDRLKTLSEFGIPRSAQVVTHVGNFLPPKDHETLVQSAAELISRKENVHLLLVGDGALMPKIRKLVAAKGLKNHIHFAGSRRDVPRLLLASDAFLFPSRWEGLPGAVLEALAAGLPVVASDIGSIREIAGQSDSMYLVPAGDASGFAQKLQEILADLQKYRKKPGQIPERFRFETYTRKMLSLYDNTE